ncbi:hypothetical protein AAE478_008685 [Parahypoxylon ruwenzoriense]
MYLRMTLWPLRVFQGAGHIIKIYVFGDYAPGYGKGDERIAAKRDALVEEFSRAFGDGVGYMRICNDTTTVQRRDDGTTSEPVDDDAPKKRNAVKWYENVAFDHGGIDFNIYAPSDGQIRSSWLTVADIPTA